MTKPEPGAAPPEAPTPKEDAPAPGAAADAAPPEAAPPPPPPEGAPVEDAAQDDPDSDGAADGDPAAEIAALKDRLLRAVAETENLRKRAAREREEAARYAISGFARDVLAVADDMARALGALPEGPRAQKVLVSDTKMLFEGLELTRRNLDAALERHGIARIDPAGEPFDPNLHEAMFEVDAPGAAPGSVVQVVEAGYRIHDRLLRPARVGVARRAAPPEEKPEDGSGGAGGGRGDGEPPP